MQTHESSTTSEAFQFKLIPPFTTFVAGAAQPTDFIVDGLMTAGGLSVVGAKPKVGKSSLSRYLAVCVASGQPFLGRNTSKGEVLLISLEDPRSHFDNCLNTLGYKLDSHSPIHLMERVSHKRQETMHFLRSELLARPDIKLIVIDHLAPFLHIGDISEYIEVQNGVNELRKLARDFPHLHVLCLAHAKKVKTEDPFDALLGSTALRGVPDTNIVLLNERGLRVIVSEARIGRPIPATILETEMVDSAGCDVVKGYSLGEAFDQWVSEKKEKAATKQADRYWRGVLEYLSQCENRTAAQKDVIDNVSGKTDRILDAIRWLEEAGVITASGKPKELRLDLEGDALELHLRFASQVADDLAEPS
jgi:hypothetical protein